MTTRELRIDSLYFLELFANFTYQLLADSLRPCTCGVSYTLSSLIQSGIVDPGLCVCE